jgi:hypothetical protein
VTISIRIILLGAAGTGRRISFVATGAVLAIALMLADEPADAQEHHLLPEISVPEPAPRGGDPKHCSDVKNGGDQSLDCLNEKLRQKVSTGRRQVSRPQGRHGQRAGGPAAIRKKLWKFRDPVPTAAAGIFIATCAPLTSRMRDGHGEFALCVPTLPQARGQRRSINRHQSH